ncbi:MAG TPA: LamG-like jellyroll fold domain-containing protein [Candidatus Sulfotelmatobacter sp.]|nr:LamG-like jellyroll fold domain-containing protein [Candidatus Sulfotelmatobacter sp.]
MKTKFSKLFRVGVAVSAFLLPIALHAQSLYSNAVMSLNPVAYWPLQETTPAPRYDMETNYGSLGSIANGYYFSSSAQATNFGAIAGDTDGSRNFLSGGNAGLVVPTTDNRVSLVAGQPFTVECWVRATEASTYCGIINQTAGIGSGGLNGAANDYGWSLVQGYAAYRGGPTPNSPACFCFHVFNGYGNLGGGEVELTNAASGEWLSGGATGYENTWIYLVSVFDGTNCWMYMYGTNLSSAYSGTNAMVYETPITSEGGQAYFGTPTLLPTAQFMPDTWDPILFGETRSYTVNHNWGGFMDEVAIYTNALTFLQISNHFNAGTNGLGNYKATILGDNPYMYWRMDAPKWTYPALSSLPGAMNYGSAAANMTNFFTGGHGADCAVYQPGTLPGVAGPTYPGFGPFTNACAFNGQVGAVDAGYNTLLDPTGAVKNFTLVGWFKGNPMDTLGARTNSLVSHSGQSWKASFRLGTAYVAKGAGAFASLAPTAAFNGNDGKWHMFALESGYFNGSTNVAFYLDSGLTSASVVNSSPIPGTNVDVWIGGAPDGAYTQLTNETSYNAAEQYLAGEVAHVAFFTNILSFDQLQTLFFTAQPAPVISRQPVSAVAGLNSAFTNSVSVEGTPPYFYQWYTNGVALGGATSPNLVINPVVPNPAYTNYYVVITNTYGAVTSSVVSLTVVSNLMFIAQYPVSYTNPISLYGGTNIDGTNYFGSTPTFTVDVVGASPAYQWLTNGVDMGGATNTSLTIEDIQMSGPTNFSCVITNIFGSITSTVWSVAYLPAPTAPFPQAVLAAQPLAYWRLSEGPDNGAGDDGAICNDYQSGNNGIYTNVFLANANGGTGYSTATDPTETSTFFGQLSPSFAGLIASNIDFSTPAGGNGEFTVAVWANGNQLGQTANAGLVTKGHWGAEQFTLDEGASPNDLRFVVRDALTGNYYAAASTVNLGNDANWHFVVGVCDEANSQLLLYVDGNLVATGTVPAGNGILNIGPVPIDIGARDSSTTPAGVQFHGYLNDAAIYNYVFSPSEVLNQYYLAGIRPYFIQQPVGGTNVDAGSTLVVSATPGGSPTLTNQWFDVLANSYIPGQTNTTLVISNIQAGDTYYLTSANAYGSTNSSTVQVFVSSGKPAISVDVQSPFYAVLGQNANNSATVYGSYPLAYQWQFSNNGSTWVNLANNSQISGAQSSSLSLTDVQAANVGDYQLVITNVYGATTSSVAPLVISGDLPLSFYGNTGLGWKTGGGASFASGVLSLTYSGEGNGTFFFDIPQYIGAFQASFIYQAQYLSTYPLADGITFCLQNDPRGPSATGSGGGDLGYTGITPSVAFQINIYPGNNYGGTGVGFGVDGNLDSTIPTGSVNLTNGLVNVWLNYANGNLGLTLSNELSAATFSTNIVTGDITQPLGGDTAYVGFTGAFGGDTSIQTVQNFQFVSIPPQAIEEADGNAMIAWPGSVNGYSLQENSDLTTTNWVNVTNSVLVFSNDMNIAIVPVTSSNQYYRLVLPLSQ